MISFESSVKNHFKRMEKVIIWNDYDDLVRHIIGAEKSLLMIHAVWSQMSCYSLQLLGNIDKQIPCEISIIDIDSKILNDLMLNKIFIEPCHGNGEFFIYSYGKVLLSGKIFNGGYYGTDKIAEALLCQP